MKETLPGPLREIVEEVRHFKPEPSNLDALRPAWQAHVAQATRQIPGVHVEAEGEALYLGDLSPGCRACKQGTWDCIFTTMRCNLDCEFCFSPHATARDAWRAGSVLGATPEQIAENHAKTTITGVSFSGGEPLMDAPALFDWVAWFTSRFPDKYYWVYTNGLLAHEENLRRLADLDIDEIRFNLAATGYDHPAVLANLEAAVRLIPNVTVEIPAIPEHAAKLLSCLGEWASRGVRFLNLHELLFEPGTNSATLPGARQGIVTADGHCSAIHPASRSLTLAVMRRVRDQGLSLSVNDCSLQSKLHQLRGRRQCLAPLTKTPHERLVGEAVESCAAYLGDDFFLFSCDSLSEVRRHCPDHHLVRLVRMAPLSLQERARWIAVEPV